MCIGQHFRHCYKSPLITSLLCQYRSTLLLGTNEFSLPFFHLKFQNTFQLHLLLLLLLSLLLLLLLLLLLYAVMSSFETVDGVLASKTGCQSLHLLEANARFLSGKHSRTILFFMDRKIHAHAMYRYFKSCKK